MAQRKVLIVEDDYQQAYSMQTQLESLNFGVAGITDNGEDAVRLAEEHRLDIIIMDIMLVGELNGVDTVTRISNVYKPCIIYVTVNSGSQSLKWIENTDYVDLISKPYTWNTLEKSLTRCGENQTT